MFNCNHTYTKDRVDASQASALRNPQRSNEQSTSRINLQIYSPTASTQPSRGQTLGVTSCQSTIQIHSPTASTANLLHSNSASASRLSLYRPPSPSAVYTTSDISLVDLSSSSKSTSNFLLPKNNALPKTSRTQPSTNQYARSRRQPPSRLHWLPNLSKIDEHVLALSVTITLALLILIGVPLGAILPQRYIVPLPMNILVPFYVYPNPGAWDRLYHAVVKHPTTNFTVILSIAHGPGSTAWPAGEYIVPIKHLRPFSNLRTIGYVDVDGGRRPSASVRADIATYAGWNVSGIGVHGIYFDRTPVRDEGHARAYLQNVSAAVRHEERFLGPRIVVHGAGGVPDAGLVGYRADVVVVFEGGYGEVPGREEMRSGVKGLGGERMDYGVVVHSVPKTVSRGGMRRIVNGVRRDVGWLFVTDRTGDEKYEDYSGRWEEFLSLIW